MLSDWSICRLGLPFLFLRDTVGSMIITEEFMSLGSPLTVTDPSPGAKRYLHSTLGSQVVLCL